MHSASTRKQSLALEWNKIKIKKLRYSETKMKELKETL